MTKPLITIITPYKNAVHFIPSFVKSLKAQTFHDWNCIVVDDGSIDSGPHLLRNLTAHDPRFIHLSNSLVKHSPGPASARNLALQHVQSKLIAFCDIDDLWLPEKLQSQISFHFKHSLDISVSAYQRFTSVDSKIHYAETVIPPKSLTYQNLFSGNPIPLLTVIVSSYLRPLYFPDISHEDYLFWLNLFASNQALRYGCLTEKLALYRVHPEGISHNKLRVLAWTYKVYRAHGLSRRQSLLSLTRWTKSHFTRIIRK